MFPSLLTSINVDLIRLVTRTYLWEEDKTNKASYRDLKIHEVEYIDDIWAFFKGNKLPGRGRKDYTKSKIY